MTACGYPFTWNTVERWFSSSLRPSPVCPVLPLTYDRIPHSSCLVDGGETKSEGTGLCGPSCKTPRC